MAQGSDSSILGPLSGPWAWNLPRCARSSAISALPDPDSVQSSNLCNRGGARTQQGEESTWKDLPAGATGDLENPAYRCDRSL
jgi:hypothetical protein